MPNLSSNATSFLQRAAKRYSADSNGIIPNITAANVSMCTNDWRRVVDVERKKSLSVPAASYAFEMVYNDVNNATSFNQTISNFELAHTCSVQAIKVWIESIMMPKATPLSAAMAAFSAIEHAFGMGYCTPKSSHPM